MFDYAKKIREYRERKCLTREELAQILNVSYVSVCRWETETCCVFNEIGMKLDD